LTPCVDENRGLFPETLDKNMESWIHPMKDELSQKTKFDMNFDTYVFDFDGVVVDSEKFHWLSYQTDVSFEKYCEINHALKGPYFRDTMDFLKKDNTYIQYINDIPLVDGFEEFYRKLVHLGKKVYIVTNTSREIFDLFVQKFPFLEDIPTVTGCKKPDPSGYISIPQPGRTVVFEDSYRGFWAASQVFSNVVLVNTPEYVYFDTIQPRLAIRTFSEL
jgi:beta-phosphoglucomutase-like phosphatase (HAD superfamily)